MANLVFSVLQTFGFAFMMYNPFVRQIFSPLCKAISKILGFVTAGSAALLIPIVQIAYNSSKWESTGMDKSPFAVWFFAQSCISGFIIFFAIVFGTITILSIVAKNKKAKKKKP